MNNIKNKILVMSGKGGVGKTTVAVNLACSLYEAGYKVGLMDADIHGPNAPNMFGLADKKIEVDGSMMKPVEIRPGLKMMSIAFLIEKEKSVIWRGPMKHNVIRQFIEQVDWGKLDYLIVDFPPGTGDEQISVAQLLEDISGAIIVSTPQKVSVLDSVKSIDFAANMKIPVIGLLENMSGSLFGRGTIEGVAKAHNVPYLGEVSADEKIVAACDSGKPVSFQAGNAKSEFDSIKDKVIDFIGGAKK